MSRVAYVDCFAGACGSMLLGAFVDAGAPIDEFRAALGGLALPPHEFGIEAERVIEKGFACTRVRVRARTGHVHRTPADVYEILRKSRLPDWVREKSLLIFERLAQAEARVHGIDPSLVHFHEVGAVDAIVDVVGVLIAAHHLKIDELFVSVLRLGSGTVHTEHGLLPVPAPATIELLRKLPVVGGNEPAELTTPTGAAILSTLAAGFGPMPAMSVQTIGCGAGERSLSIANILRVFIGEADRNTSSQEQVDLLECNLDDMSGEDIAFAVEELLAAGALDAWTTPITMKKGRPALLLSALAAPGESERIRELLFARTSTLGVRVARRERHSLARENLMVETQFGPVPVKLARTPSGRLRSVKPEFDSLSDIARERGIPLDAVRRAVNQACERLFEADAD